MLGKKEKKIFENPGRLNSIVEGTKIVGSLTSESNIRIDGEITGNVFSAGKVVIGETGYVKGDLSCYESEILGKLEGNVRVDQLLVLKDKAVIHGDIFTNRIQIEEGAIFEGQCKVYGNIPEKKEIPPIIVTENNPGDIVY